MQPNDAGRGLGPGHQDSTAYDRLEGDAEEISAAVQARRFAIQQAFDDAEAKANRELRERAGLPTAYVKDNGTRIAFEDGPGELIEADSAANLEGWR